MLTIASDRHIMPEYRQKCINAGWGAIRALLAYLMTAIGYVFELVITFPYIVMVSLDRSNASGRNGSQIKSNAFDQGDQVEPRPD